MLTDEPKASEGKPIGLSKASSQLLPPPVKAYAAPYVPVAGAPTTIVSPLTPTAAPNFLAPPHASRWDWLHAAPELPVVRA